MIAYNLANRPCTVVYILSMIGIYLSHLKKFNKPNITAEEFDSVGWFGGIILMMLCLLPGITLVPLCAVIAGATFSLAGDIYGVKKDCDIESEIYQDIVHYDNKWSSWWDYIMISQFVHVAYISFVAIWICWFYIKYKHLFRN